MNQREREAQEFARQHGLSFHVYRLIEQARKEGAAAQRRRIRRAIAPHVATLAGLTAAFRRTGGTAGDMSRVALEAIDRATKAPRGRAPGNGGGRR